MESNRSVRGVDRGFPRWENVYSDEFRRKVQHKRMVEMPAPKVRFRVGERRTPEMRRQRSELTRLAKLINEQTRQLTASDADRGLSVKSIILDTARRHGVSVDDICGESVSGYIVAVRHQAMCRVYLAHYPKMSFQGIGRKFGGRDHTTVLHAVRKAGVHRGSHGA